MSITQEFRDEVNKAVTLTEQLFGLRPAPKGATPISRDELPRSEGGVGYAFQKKGALLITAASGRGFVVAKLPEAGAWSAPLFFKLAHVGVGISLGYTNIDSMILIKDRQGIDAFSDTRSMYEVEATGAAGETSNPELAVRFDKLQEDKHAKEFSVAKGVMLDVSPLAGEFFIVDDKRNRAFYGPNVARADILSGAVEPPAAAQPLYDTLNRIQGIDKADNAGGSDVLGVGPDDVPVEVVEIDAVILEPV